MSLRDRYAAAGVTLDIAGVGTTGYGELLFNRALHADYHTVETVAHAHAATRYEPHASFILDIGGQDMKAIWLSDGIIGNIVVNEACSSGCGSFLENFAQTLGVPTPEIADAAFTSEQPAVLGSRCTVFMNSSIVSEQKNGRTPADIMAGLCRSIIANVFTKVVRVPNLDSLGESISWCKAARFATTRYSAPSSSTSAAPSRVRPTPGSWALSASRCSRATT